MNISGAQRLASGHTLVCHGPQGRFFEVTRDSQIVWVYGNPVADAGPILQGDTMPGGPQGKRSNVFRAPRYAADYPGLAGRDLRPGYPLERYQTPTTAAAEPVPTRAAAGLEMHARPNPARSAARVSFSLPEDASVELVVYTAAGRAVRRLNPGRRPAGRNRVDWDGRDESGRDPGRGVYLLTLATGGRNETLKLVRTE
jgi:hypothetical protein